MGKKYSQLSVKNITAKWFSHILGKHQCYCSNKRGGGCGAECGKVRTGLLRWILNNSLDPALGSLYPVITYLQKMATSIAFSVSLQSDFAILSIKKWSLYISWIWADVWLTVFIEYSKGKEQNKTKTKTLHVWASRGCACLCSAVSFRCCEPHVNRLWPAHWRVRPGSIAHPQTASS